LIRHSIASYARLFAYELGRDWRQMQAAALSFIPVLERHAPDILLEIEGIADGAGREPAEILALNVRTELLAGSRRTAVHPDYPAALERNRQGNVPISGECTTVAAVHSATAGDKAFLAQTWDWYGEQRAACILLRIEAPGEPAILTMTEAGIVAKIGLNSAGIGVTLNILYSNQDGEMPGMPVHVLLRRILQGSNVDDALERAHAARAGASSCVTVVSAEGDAMSLEVTPQGVGILRARDGMLVHTNHCLVPDIAREQLPPTPAGLASTTAHYGRATELLKAAQGTIDQNTLIDVLCDHEQAPSCICRHPQPEIPAAEQAESVTGIVMDLQERTMYVAPGIPCQVPFTAVRL
jgi:isopenicillin-N N-acyltransferase-like protein